MVPKADRQKAKKEWLDACPVPEILVDEVDGGKARTSRVRFVATRARLCFFTLGLAIAYLASLVRSV